MASADAVPAKVPPSASKGDKAPSGNSNSKPSPRRIIAQDEEREIVPSGEWPMQPQFWQSDVMNDVMFSTKDSIIPSHSEPTLSLDWNKFGLIQWIDLIKNNNLLNGVRMDQESGPTPGAYPLVRTPPRLEYFHTYRNTNALNNSHTTYSLRESKYIAHGWTPASLSSSSFFLSANDTSRLRTASENSVYEDIYTIAKYMYAFVTIVLDPMDMDPTEKFSNAIEAALKREDDAEKRKELESVFKKYGHSFQTEVTLGGQLVATEITKANVNVSKEQVAQELCAKLSGGIQAATSPHQSTPVSVPVYTGGVIRIETQQIVVKTKGGNPLLSNGLASWIPSLADYRNWRIIEVIDAVPVTEFIRDATMKAEVEKLIMPRGKPLRGRWVKPFEFNTNAEGGSGVAWFTTYRPEVGNSGWRWLGPSLDSTRALIVRENHPGSGALCEITNVSKIHTSAGSQRATDDESFWALHPSDTDYVALGNFFQSRQTRDHSYLPPNLNCAELKTLCGVRRDLCERATLKSSLYWNNHGESGTYWVSVFQPEKVPTGSPVEDPHLFLAFPNSGDFATNAKSEIWMLKSDSIDIEPFD